MSRFASSLLLMAALLAAGCSVTKPAPAAGGHAHQAPAQGEAHAHQPYAGLEKREIKALAPERADDLLAGRGAQYALAAELNHYPGPTHALDLAADLKLSADQERQIRQIKEEHNQRAKELGRQIVDLERALDQAFRSGQVTAAELERLVTQISALDGRLRLEHLATHLMVRPLFSEEQVRRYDQLRGYSH